MGGVPADDASPRPWTLADRRLGAGLRLHRHLRLRARSRLRAARTPPRTALPALSSRCRDRTDRVSAHRLASYSSRGRRWARSRAQTAPAAGSHCRGITHYLEICSDLASPRPAMAFFAPRSPRSYRRLLPLSLRYSHLYPAISHTSLAHPPRHLLGHLRPELTAAFSAGNPVAHARCACRWAVSCFATLQHRRSATARRSRSVPHRWLCRDRRLLPPRHRMVLPAASGTQLLRNRVVD